MSESSSPFVSLASVSPQKQTWLWRGRIPLGAITVLEGDPGQGKSLLTCDWMARVTRGWPFPGDEPNPDPAALAETQEFLVPAGVVLLEAEDHLATTVVPRLLAAGANLSRVSVSNGSASAERSWQLPRDVHLLEQAIHQAHARLVVIDPLAAYLPAGVQGDSQVRRALQPLSELAQRTGVAVVLVRHFVKENGRRAISAGAGSMGIIGVARSALAVQSLPENFDPRRELLPLPNDANGVIQLGKLSPEMLRFTHCLTVIKGNLGHAAPLIYRTGSIPDGALRMQWLGRYEPSVSERLAPAKGLVWKSVSEMPRRAARSDRNDVATRSNRHHWLRAGWDMFRLVAKGLGRGAVSACRMLGPTKRRRR